MKISVKGSINNESRIKTRYPFGLVWTSLPCITFFIPSIGHTGICTSDGIIHDFGGSYYIAIDDFSFGDPKKYMILNVDPEKTEEWDKAIREADEKFAQEEHNLINNNCHHHVAEVLNRIKYQGRKDWGMIGIWWLLLKQGKYVSFSAFIKTQFFYILIGIIIIIVLLVIYLS